MRRCLLVLLAALALGACRPEPVVIGSKQSVENRILAEIFARLLEDAGLPVVRRIGLGDSPETFAAIRAGTIDLYPEYTGTALGLLGAPPTPDTDAALATARDGFAPLDLAFLDPLGFQSTYTVVTRRDLADRLRLETVSDLAGPARRLRLGVTRAFADRAADGLQPFLDRFGLVFADLRVLPDTARETLYDALLEDRLDVIVGFSTDPEIGDYGLVQLLADKPFFPAYEAVPLVDAATLAREPAIAEALAPLAGRITPQMMRRLVRQAQVFGRPPEAVAGDALRALGIDTGVPSTSLPGFRIAADLPLVGPAQSTRVLRALREAVPGREVELLSTPDPLAAVTAGEARVAVVPALSLFEAAEGDLRPREGFEAIAVTGTAYLHALAGRGAAPDALAQTRSIAAGPAGTPAARLARAIEAVSQPAPAVIALADTRPGTLASAIADGVTETGLVLGTRGLPALDAALSGTGDLRLVDAAHWWRGPVRLALPFLREAVLPVGTYRGQDRALSALAMQTALVGPAPQRDRVIGIMGPGTSAQGQRPLAGKRLTRGTRDPRGSNRPRAPAPGFSRMADPSRLPDDAPRPLPGDGSASVKPDAPRDAVLPLRATAAPEDAPPCAATDPMPCRATRLRRPPAHGPAEPRPHWHGDGGGAVHCRDEPHLAAVPLRRPAHWRGVALASIATMHTRRPGREGALEATAGIEPAYTDLQSAA